MTKDKLKKQEIGIVKKQGILGRVVNEAYLSIGSNLGDKKSNLDKAKYLLSNLNIQIINCSSILTSISVFCFSVCHSGLKCFTGFRLYSCVT